MNKVYRTVFNEKTNTWVAVAETAKAHGKSGRSGGVVAAVADGMFLSKKMLAVSAAVAAAMAAQPAMADNARIENGSANWTIAISPRDSTAGNGNAKATGEYSTAVGYEASAGHQWGVAIGYKAKTEGDNSLALGPLAKAGTSGSWGTAIGYNADAGGSASPLAVGTMSKTSGESPIAIGDWATGEGDGAVAIGSKNHGQHLPGKSTYAKGNHTVALGSLAQATQEKALALGANANAAQRNSIAIGNEAEVGNSPANSSNSSIAIGDKAKAQGDLALAIGPGATVSGESAAGGIAIGSAATSKNGGMAVGSGANAGNGTPMIPGLPDRLNNNVALGDSALVKDDTNFRVALGSFSIAGESDLTAAPYKPTANANVAGIAESGVELGEVSVGGDNTAGMGKILYRRVTNVAAGAADTDAVNVSQLKAAQAAATSKVAAGNGISVTPTVDANTGSTTYTVAADTTTLNVGDGTGGNPAGKVITPTGADANKLAKAGDIANAINNSGFQATVGGNLASSSTATATTVKPGQEVTFAAGAGLTVEQKVDTDGNQRYTYALAQDINLGANGRVKTGATQMDNNGITITAPTSGNKVSLTSSGLNNGGNKITNVAAGTAGTDAVNVSQLNQALGSISGANTANFTALNNKVNEVAADAKAGTAAAMAVAGLPQAYLPGKSMMAVGGSVYRGESGYAIGYSTISDGGNWIIKGTATGNSRGHYGATAAVGYQW